MPSESRAAAVIHVPLQSLMPQCAPPYHSELVLASTKTSWPFKPTTVTAQADVDRFNKAFLALLALQLECVALLLTAFRLSLH